MKFNGQLHREPLQVESIDEKHVTLADVQQQLRMEGETLSELEQAEINGFIVSSIELAQEYKGMFLAKTTLKQKVYNFNGSELMFCLSPVLAIFEVKNGTDLIAAEKYYLEINHTYFVLRFYDNVEAEELSITFTAGFAAGKLKENHKNAIKLKAADLYDTERSSFSHNIVQNQKTFQKLLGSPIDRY